MVQKQSGVFFVDFPVTDYQHAVRCWIGHLSVIKISLLSIVGVGKKKKRAIESHMMRCNDAYTIG